MAATMYSVSSGHEEGRSHEKQGLLRLVAKCHFSPHCHFKTFKNRGAVLVMLWAFCGFFVFQYLMGEQNYQTPLRVTNKQVQPFDIFIMCLLLYPVIGWLADVRFGRYQVIKWSFRVLWALLVLSCLVTALLQYYYNTWPKNLRGALTIAFYIPISLCVGGISANIVHFSVDQLANASSQEVTSHIRWMVWVWYCSGSCLGLSQWCVCKNYESFNYLLLPIILTVAVTGDFLFSNWFIKEPVESNPFALIFKVLKYAIRNKYPRLRSAFTYGEEKPYTRIDLAKNKYGGPFTTEQVEDVKTFFRIIGIMAAAALFTSMFLLVYPSFAIVSSRLQGGQYSVMLKNCSYLALMACLQRTAVAYSGDYCIIIIIPIYQLLLSKRWFGRVTILWRLNFGLVLLFVSLIACTVLEFVAVHEYSRNQNRNTSIECALNATGEQDSILPLDYKWTIVYNAPTSFAKFLLLSSFTEFLCAQSPYSMKGLLFGFTLGAIGFFVIIGYSVSKPLQDYVIVKFMSFGYGCMAWYLVLNLTILLITLLLFCGAYKCYKSRYYGQSTANDHYSSSHE